MIARTIVKPNKYFDSVTLMRISGDVAGMDGVEVVMVGMGTDLNKDSLARVELLTDEARAASPNDLMIGVRAVDEAVLEQVFAKAEELFTTKRKSKTVGSEGGVQQPRSIAQACEEHPGFNLAMISVPGPYAAREAREALRQEMHVFLFSDNVGLEDEISLKKLANEKGLLMMGPDCGTSIINGIPLGFANRVRRGKIGIVGASGTGIQQVTTLIDSLGEGISQAIGTGGRDLSEHVGGRTCLAALEALARDAETEVIVLISKPPALSVAEKIIDKAAEANKPIVFCLLGRSLPVNGRGIIQCANLEETALKAVSLVRGGAEVSLPEEDVERQIVEAQGKKKPGQKYVRALYGGGTICDEAMMVFKQLAIPFYTNIALTKEDALADVEKSEGNTFLDMGEDYFTRGRPHPMLEPRLRTPRLLQEAADPEVAVILLDVILGHGSHSDPAGVAVEGVKKAREIAAQDGRELAFVAALVGTSDDPQGMDRQRKLLEDAGLIVCSSNVRAANVAARILG
jgi:succinyl-CoA synthetase alpha subunit